MYSTDNSTGHFISGVNNLTPYSIYIPRISKHFTSNDVIFALRSIGLIQRVDFTYVGQKPGFCFNPTENRSAFVHFEHLYVTHYTNYLRYELDEGRSVRCDIGGGKYLILLKNSRPIPSTLMNITQVTENCRLLEEKVQELSSKISAQDEKISAQDEKISEQAESIKALLEVSKIQSVAIERLQRTVYDVIGSKFNQETEMNQVYSLVNYMHYGTYLDTRWAIDADDDGSDKYKELSEKEEISANEERSKAYEEEQQRIFEEEEEKEKQRRREIYELYYGSHIDNRWAAIDEEDDGSDQYKELSEEEEEISSMPSLVSVTTSEEDDYEVPVVSDDESSQSTNSLTKRMRNSAELCGNN